MLDFFCEQVGCPEVPAICAKLDSLKRRISSGDYTTPKIEFDECQYLFDSIKQRAIVSKNESLANAQFIYKAYFQIFCTLSAYFGLLEKREYRSSWSVLQDCLDGIKFTGKFLDSGKRKELPELYKLLEDYESLYPYTVFSSSEYIISKSHCSICGKSMQVPSCPHIRGHLYYGEIAREVIDEIQEFQAVCLVSHPEDKRCVIEISNDNRSEEEKFAKLAKFLDLHLQPLQRFSIQSTIETREREGIVKVGRNQPCSCGSGVKFKKCCGQHLYYQHEKNIITTKSIVRLV